MKQKIKIQRMWLYILALSSLLISTESALSAKSSNTISFQVGVLYLKHLSNQSTIILYSNNSIIMYDPYLNYMNSIIVTSTKDKIYKMDISQKQTVFIIFYIDETNFENIKILNMIDLFEVTSINSQNSLYFKVFQANDWHNTILIYPDYLQYWKFNSKENIYNLGGHYQSFTQYSSIGQSLVVRCDTGLNQNLLVNIICFTSAQDIVNIIFTHQDITQPGNITYIPSAVNTLYNAGTDLQSLIIRQNRMFIQKVNYQSYIVQDFLIPMGLISLSSFSKRLDTIFIDNGYLYVIFDNQLMQYTINQDLLTVTLINSSIMPAFNTKQSIFITKSINEQSWSVYQSNSTSIYHLTSCQQNERYVYDVLYKSNVCVSKTCTDKFCVSCSFNQNYCNQCQVGYQLHKYVCKQVVNGALQQYILIIQQKIMQSQILRVINKNSAIRTSLNMLFEAFVPIDDLWIYSYLDRNYTLTVKNLLNSIRYLQSNKFNPFNYIPQVGQFTSKIKGYFNNTLYSKKKFVEVQGQASGFYPNVVDFFLLTVTQNLMVFVLSRLFFYIFFQYKISKLVREYSFNCFFVITLLDGNVQFFAYVSSNQLQILFNDKFQTKIQNFMFILILFVSFQIAIAFYMFLKYLLKKKVVYFLDNNKDELLGLASLIITKYIRNIILSAISSYYSSSFNQVIILFILTETIYVIILAILISKFKVFIIKFKLMGAILFCLIRIALQFSFWIFQTQRLSYDLEENIQLVILVVYLCSWLTSFIINGFIRKQSFSKKIPLLKQIKQRKQINKINKIKKINQINIIKKIRKINNIKKIKIQNKQNKTKQIVQFQDNLSQINLIN